ncbi:MAG: LysR substrate-binding domain-containing protein [Pseudomonadota bacterium]
MRYAQLRAFHHVAVAGGFSRAAEALNQSQPSISDQVRRLEEAHDTLLFQRDTRHVRLTEAGEGLLRLTRSFFEAEGEIADYLDRNRAAPTGELRIVADSAVHITAAIGRFRVAHPGVTVSLWTGNTEEVLARLRRYEAEIGVVANVGKGLDLHRVELGRTPVVAIAARSMVPGDVSEIAFRDLPRWPLIFREPGSRTRALVEAAARESGVVLTSAIQIEGREAMRDVVATGAGIGFLSEAEFGHDARLRKLRLTGVDLGMTETLVTLAARRDVAVIRAFLKSMA